MGPGNFSGAIAVPLLGGTSAFHLPSHPENLHPKPTNQVHLAIATDICHFALVVVQVFVVSKETPKELPPKHQSLPDGPLQMLEAFPVFGDI